MEQLIRELNDPVNQSSSEKIDVIQKQIQRLQREPSAWQLGLDLLNHAEAIMRFYGALTLTIKVNADWDRDKVGEDRALVNHLIENLVSSYVRLASVPDVAFVLQKLCGTLVAVFQRPDAAWAFPSRHVLGSMIVGHFLTQTDVPDLQTLLQSGGEISGHQLKAVLMLVTTLAEELSSTAEVLRAQNLRVRFANNSKDVWLLLYFCCSRLAQTSTRAGHPKFQLSVSMDENQSREVATMVMQTAPHWTKEVKIRGQTSQAHTAFELVDMFQTVVETFVTFFNQPALAVTAVRAFTALEQYNHKLLRNTNPDYAESIVKSTQSAEWIRYLQAGDFDSDYIEYVDFLQEMMSQVDVTSPDYLSKEQYVETLQQALQLLSCDGVAGVEDPVCQIALETLSSVTEAFSDWEEPSSFDESVRTLIRNTFTACVAKVRIPAQELSTTLQTWDLDERAKFRDFRYDVKDFLQNAFTVHGESLVQEIVQSIISSSDWSAFEAGVFAVRAFSDTMSNEPERYDQYVEAILSCEKWKAATKSETPDRVRQQLIKLLGENTAFLERNSQHLVGSLNFLFDSLHIHASASHASRAICALCDTQRSSLREALPHFMNSLTTISDLDLGPRNRIFTGVSAIIQALPSEDAKLEPLSRILNMLKNDAEAIFARQLDLVELQSTAAGILQVLAAIGRGLRTSSDNPIDIDEIDNKNKQFWTNGQGQPVQELVLQLYGALLERTSGYENADFVEMTCEWLKSGFTEDHPSPFKFSTANTLEILSRHIRLDTPRPDPVMSTATSYLASTTPKDIDNNFALLLSGIVQLCQEALSLAQSKSETDSKSNQQSATSLPHTDFLTSSLDFFNRLLPKWGQTWFAMPTATSTASIVIETALILIQDPDTLTRRAAASFFTSFLDTTASTSIAADPTASSAMISTLQAYGPRILASNLSLVAGECARSDIDHLAEPIKKFVQKQPLMANRLMKEAMKAENTVLSPRALEATKVEMRMRVASQVEMLRGQGRKVNEILREFWMSCRGGGFGYVT